MNDKELLWGHYTWLLFHTLAEKIKEEEFLNEKDTLIFYIKNICQVLPCPDCSSHATHLLKFYRYNVIKTKDDFKKFLFEFHNIVNEKRKIKKEDISVLDTYKKAILYKIIYAWNKVFTVGGVNSRLLTDNMHRNRLKKDFIKYLCDNKHKFDV